MPVHARSLADRFRRRRHAALLIAIIAAFAVRPLIGDTGLSPIVFSLTLMVLLLIALLNIQVDELAGGRRKLLARRQRLALVAWILAVPAVVERVLVLVAPSHTVMRAGSLCWLLFVAFVTWCQLLNVLEQKRVTGETICNAVSVYLLTGLTWGLLYAAIFSFDPSAFHFGDAGPPELHHSFPTFIYFSLTTIATIGFGDITPASLQAQYAAVAEGIAGQFYLVILIGRLVALQMSQPGESP